MVTGYVFGFDVYDELVPIAWAHIIATMDSAAVFEASSMGGGYFEMFLPVGFYNLTVEEFGFISKTMQIFVSSGSTLTLQFILEQGQRVYTYEATVYVSGLPSEYYSNLRVDGTYTGMVSGGTSKTFLFKIGSTHRIDVDPYVNGPAGVRYHAKNVNWTVNGRESRTFTYQSEYYLRIEKGLAKLPLAEGWYGEGASMQTVKAPELVNGTRGVRYVFEYWMVDGAKVSGNPIAIVMDGPHNVSSRYRTQYYVDVRSEYDNPTGSGWFDENSMVNVSVTMPPGFGVRKVFDRWEGDQTSTSPTISILVNSPKTLTAVWHDDYTQVYLAIAIIAALIVATFAMTRRKKAKMEIQPKS